jgi:GT2 family glycosyltransferase
VLDDLSDAAERAQPRKAAALFLHGPKQGAAGTLAALDALALLRRRGLRLRRPLSCSGPEMVFAPMLPRDFASYWSTRGFVRELLEAGQWAWAAVPPQSKHGLPVRLYPSCFEHLPSVWFELARGSAVALSEAAAEGLVPPEALPRLARIEGKPDARDIAASIEAVSGADPEVLDDERLRLCRAVIDSHRGPLHARRFDDMISGLKTLLREPGRPELGAVARLLLDRTRPAAAAADALPVPSLGRAADASLDLTVVVIGYEMGNWLCETVESVWTSRPLPDEVLLVDDGSVGRPTLRAIEDLETAARQRRLPLRVLRQPNAGLARARNAGLAAARGRFISFLDGDDLIAPDFYRYALDLLKSEPRLGGVAAWAETFGEGVAPGFWNAPQPELPLLLVENTVFVPCMVRTGLLRQLGGYDPHQRYNYEDWELSIRLLASGHPIIAIPRYLHRYRVRGDSLLRTMTPAQNQNMRELLLEKHRATLERFPVEVAMLLESRLMKVMHAERPKTVERFRLLPVRLAQRIVRRLAARSAGM